MEKNIEFYKSLLDNLYDGVYFLDQERSIRYWNKGAERITGYSRSEVEGFRCQDNILMHVDSEGASLCQTRCPARKTMDGGIPAEAEVFLHHKNGHRIPVNVRVTPIRDESGAIVGAVEIFRDNSEKLASLSLIEELQEKAFQDTLTSLPNRRYLDRYLMSKLDESSRYDWTFGLIFFDIDHFKAVNDTYGHDVGDEALKMLARTLVHSSRSFDTVGRWGGEEFVVVVANVDSDKLRSIAERYRSMVENSTVTTGSVDFKMTVSLGATLACAGDTLDSLVKRADGLMYQSKMAGRNRVTLG
ncbi:MAG: diguanylate cyclase [Syntrophobacterales bacterium]|nr:MAG: diguanylate cyclase [Syntrophobacterales bacterium]